MVTIGADHYERNIKNQQKPSLFGKKSQQDFDLEYVLHSFRKCLGDGEVLILEEYLKAFHELCRFFTLTGPLFSFVARDLESKIKAIEYQILNDNGNNYHSIQSMIGFEVLTNKAHHKGHHPSGSRTLLRLHYALEFILLFMDRIAASDDQAKTSSIAWQAYSESLIKHHPWITQKLAFVAVYALPSKQTLIEIMCKHDYDKVKSLLSEVTEVGQCVYHATQKVYNCHGIIHIS